MVNDLNSLKSVGEQIRRIVRRTLPKSLYVQCAMLLDSWYGIRAFGLNEYRNLSATGREPIGGPPVAMRLRPLPHPFYVRPGAPDANLVLHAIAREAYSYKLPDRSVHLIVDAGANIGDTTVWYSVQFPEAVVVAIEPNPDNFEILSRNCAPYGNRIHLFNGALWPVPNRSLAITGATESAQVRELTQANDSTCTSIDPLTILRNSGAEAIDVFKIDIEGAELELFSGDCDTWLSKTRCIAIEIHSAEAREVVLSATRRNGFTFNVYRDIYVFWK